MCGGTGTPLECLFALPNQRTKYLPATTDLHRLLLLEEGRTARVLQEHPEKLRGIDATFLEFVQDLPLFRRVNRVIVAVQCHVAKLTCGTERRGWWRVYRQRRRGRRFRFDLEITVVGLLWDLKVPTVRTTCSGLRRRGHERSLLPRGRRGLAGLGQRPRRDHTNPRNDKGPDRRVAIWPSVSPFRPYSCSDVQRVPVDRRSRTLQGDIIRAVPLSEVALGCAREHGVGWCTLVIAWRLSSRAGLVLVWRMAPDERSPGVRGPSTAVMRCAISGSLTAVTS